MTTKMSVTYPIEMLTFCKEKLLEREEKRLEKRQETIKNNDVWEYRTSPPEDFNVELPKRLQHREVENGRKQACTIS